MAKRKDRKQVAALYESVTRLAGQSLEFEPATRLRPKQFRSQLLHAWMVAHLAPCRVADIGGGKGLLSYLLQESGWEATVIDPERQALPAKYTDLEGRTVRVPPSATVPYRAEAFRPELAE